MQWLASPSPEAQSSRPPSRSPLQPHAATAVAQTCCNISPRRTGLVPSLPGQGLAGRLGHKLSDKRAGGNRTSNVGEVHCLQPSELAWLHWQKRKVRPQRGRQRATGVSRLEVWAQSPHHPCPPAPPLCPLPPGPTLPLMGRSLHRSHASWSLPAPPSLRASPGPQALCLCPGVPATSAPSPAASNRGWAGRSRPMWAPACPGLRAARPGAAWPGHLSAPLLTPAPVRMQTGHSGPEGTLPGIRGEEGQAREWGRPQTAAPAS